MIAYHSGDAIHAKDGSPRMTIATSSIRRAARLVALPLVAGAVLLAACGGTEDSTNGQPNANGTATTPTTAASATTASGTQTAAKKYATEPAMSIDVSKQYTATIATAKGTIVVALNAKAAPETVNNFVF